MNDAPPSYEVPDDYDEFDGDDGDNDDWSEYDDPQLYFRFEETQSVSPFLRFTGIDISIRF